MKGENCDVFVSFFALPVQWVLCVSQREMNGKSTGFCAGNPPWFAFASLGGLFAENLWRAMPNVWNEEENDFVFREAKHLPALLELSPFFSITEAGFHLRKYFSLANAIHLKWNGNKIVSEASATCSRRRRLQIVGMKENAEWAREDKTENRSRGSSPHPTVAFNEPAASNSIIVFASLYSFTFLSTILFWSLLRFSATFLQLVIAAEWIALNEHELFMGSEANEMVCRKIFLLLATSYRRRLWFKWK